MVSRIHTKNFTWVPEEKLFVAEASDFHGINLFGRVFGDSCDAGFDLVSDKTGDVRAMALDHTEKDAEGDTLWWDFTPFKIRNPNRRDPFRSGDFKVRIFND